MWTWQHCWVGQGFLEDFPPDWPALPRVVVYCLTQSRAQRALGLSTPASDTSTVSNGSTTCSWGFLPSSDSLSDWGGTRVSSHACTPLLLLWNLTSGCSSLYPIFWARRCDWYLTLQRGQATEGQEIHHSLPLSRQDRTRPDVGMNLSLWVHGSLQMRKIGRPLLWEKTIFFTEASLLLKLPPPPPPPISNRWRCYIFRFERASTDCGTV